MGSAGLGSGDTNVLSRVFSMERIAFYLAFLLQICTRGCPGTLNYPLYLYNPLTGQPGRKYFQSRKVLNILSYLVVKRTFYLLILSYCFAKVVKGMALARIIALILLLTAFVFAKAARTS